VTTIATETDSVDVLRDATGWTWNEPAIATRRIPMDALAFSYLVGRGSFGEVFKGTYDGADVAIKRLLPARRENPQHVAAFVSEIKLLASLQHDGIVRFVGAAWRALGDVCLVTEFLAMGDLRAVLQSFDATQPRPRGFDADKLKIALHVARALRYMHSLAPAVIHRDLKSKNILLTPTFDAKIADFGTSRACEDMTMTAEAGTSLWMAPEVLLGQRYDAKADVFSFGVVLSELDTHELPYARVRALNMTHTAIVNLVSQGMLTAEFTEGANEQLVDLGRDCVRKNPKERPSSVEVVERVEQALRDFGSA
jgi:serine/threonine-protein kinase TNNI3K